MKSSFVTLIIFLMLPLISYGYGFDENYEVRYGDFDNDGLQDDLYIRKKPQVAILHGDIVTPIVIPTIGDVQEFVLQDKWGLYFEIQSNLTTTQKDAFELWPEAALELVLADFNIDGEADVLLKGLSTVILGKFDQIVFASSTVGLAPQAVTAVDVEFQQFFDELFNWIINPNYFVSNAPTVTTPITVDDWLFLPEYCATPNWVAQNGPLSNLPAIGLQIQPTIEDIYQSRDYFIGYCMATGKTVFHYDLVSSRYTIPSWDKDYSIFNPGALALSELVSSYQLLSEFPLSSMEAQDLANLVSDEIGAQFCFGNFAGCPVITVIEEFEWGFGDVWGSLKEWAHSVFTKTEKASNPADWKEVIKQELLDRAKNIMGEPYATPADAALALHNEDDLMEYAREIDFEIWAVIDKDTNEIKEVSTGFSKDRAYGIWKGTYEDGDSGWHSHPDNDEIENNIHAGDIDSCWKAKASWCFVSDSDTDIGGELSRMEIKEPSLTTPPLFNYTSYPPYEGEIIFPIEVFRNNQWETSPIGIVKEKRPLKFD